MLQTHIVHPIGPLYDKDSRILILGSFPSVKSREQNFFYGHPQNRFWPLMARILDEPIPVTIEQKKALVLSHGIAIWDTIYSCDITGSSDSSIRNVVPTDLKSIIEGSQISRIFCNGSSSGRCFERYQEKALGRKATVLPSTSPANAAWNLDRLYEVWKTILV